jgi:hypothetical protein
MGEILSKPVTETHVVSQLNSEFFVSAAAMQGFRVSMEDAHRFVLNLTPETSYFSVFDGHNGNESFFTINLFFICFKVMLLLLLALTGCMSN